MIVVPAEKVLPAIVEFLGSPKASSEGKVTALHWIQNLLKDGKAERCLDAVLKAAAAVSMDKAIEVREAASKLANALTEVRERTSPSRIVYTVCKLPPTGLPKARHKT